MNNILGRLDLLNKELQQLASRSSDCHPDDRRFYEQIGELYIAKIKGLKKFNSKTISNCPMCTRMNNF